MVSRQQLISTLLIVLMMSLLLAGCTRPVPEGEATAVVADANESEPDTSDPNVGGGTGLDTATAAPSYPAEAEVISETAVISETKTISETAVISETVVAEVTPEATAEQPAAATATPEAAPETTTETAVSTTTTTATCPTDHVVQPGENLFRIGLQYGLSWVTLAQYNGITNPNNIVVGQTIKIPCPGTTPPPPPTPPTDNVTYYTVQPGDNLYQIGLKFGVSWVEIAEANGLVNPNQIYAGQVLKIPTSTPGPRP